MENLWSSVSLQFLQPVLGFFFDAHFRHFWLYVATGLVIAAIAHRVSSDKRTFAQAFFAREVWLSRSAINDYFIMTLNPAIKFVLFAWILAYFGRIADIIGGGIRALGVSGETTDEAALIAGAGLTVALYVVNDFMRWLLHFMQHRVPALWELHKVHHSAEHLNFATAERHHPLDLLFFSSGMALAMGAVNGVFIGVFGDQLTVATVSGANVLWVASNVIGGVLRHSPAWVSYGPKVERWLISPAMHHIHHSDDPKHFDKNMGGSLAIWDRMFGTLYIPQGREALGFGLGAETAEYRSLSALYWLPLKKAARVLTQRG